MFWGLIMEPGKKYTQTVGKSFHISKASLDLDTATNEPVQILVSYSGRVYLICTLQKDRSIQESLDLMFQSGDKISFATNGPGHVHLTGYLIPEDESDMDESDSDEDAEEEVNDDVPELMQSKKRKAKDKDSSDLKKPKLTLNDIVEAEDSDDSDFTLSNVLEEEVSVEESGEEEESEDDDDDDDDGAEAEEEEAGDEESEDDEDEEQSDDEHMEQESPASPIQQNGISKKMKKEIKKKQDKLGKMQKNQKNEILKSPNKEESKTPKKEDGKDGKTPGKDGRTPGKDGRTPGKDGKTAGKQGTPMKKIEGGVTIEELKVGDGQVAQPGKVLQVYYEGRLKSNNKMFDSSTKGAGFKFRLGRQEVIKGWDAGLAGMKVGGKRRITCPPHMAYGAQGSPPVIPPNSTLVFEVELKKVYK